MQELKIKEGLTSFSYLAMELLSAIRTLQLGIEVIRSNFHFYRKVGVK